MPASITQIPDDAYCSCGAPLARHTRGLGRGSGFRPAWVTRDPASHRAAQARETWNGSLGGSAQTAFVGPGRHAVGIRAQVRHEERVPAASPEHRHGVPSQGQDAAGWLAGDLLGAWNGGPWRWVCPVGRFRLSRARAALPRQLDASGVRDRRHRLRGTRNAWALGRSAPPVGREQRRRHGQGRARLRA